MFLINRGFMKLSQIQDAATEGAPKEYTNNTATNFFLCIHTASVEADFLSP